MSTRIYNYSKLYIWWNYEFKSRELIDKPLKICKHCTQKNEGV